MPHTNHGPTEDMNEEVDKSIHDEHFFTLSMRRHNLLPIYYGITMNGHMKKHCSEATIKVLKLAETLISQHQYATRISDRRRIDQISINQQMN